jgi:hypothetical protein
MIIWIASYPKSGNTWIRSFLSSYIYTNDGTFNFNLLNKIDQFPLLKYYNKINLYPKNLSEAAQGWVTAQQVINLDNKIHFMKTHNAMCTINGNPFTNKENSLGAIYIVRDPRDILISYSNFLNMNYSETLNELTRKNNTSFLNDTVDTKNIVGSLMGSWSENFNSWEKYNLTKKIIIRYEDLISNPYETFLKIITYLNNLYGLEINKKKIQMSIESTKFVNLQNLEKRNMFFEKSKNTKVFFREGKIKQWEKKLDIKMLNKIKEKFSKEMIKLGYL